jgi:hypothetical protein
MGRWFGWAGNRWGWSRGLGRWPLWEPIAPSPCGGRHRSRARWWIRWLAWLLALACVVGERALCCAWLHCVVRYACLCSLGCVCSCWLALLITVLLCLRVSVAGLLGCMYCCLLLMCTCTYERIYACAYVVAVSCCACALHQQRAVQHVCCRRVAEAWPVHVCVATRASPVGRLPVWGYLARGVHVRARVGGLPV